MFEVVVMVADEASLLEATEKLSPNLVVVDLSLPLPWSERGHIAHQLKRRDPTLKVITLGVYDEVTVLREMPAAGVEGFVLKRAATDMTAAVQAMLQGRSYISPGVKGHAGGRL